MMKTSRSGSVNGTAAFQLLVGRSSFQFVDRVELDDQADRRLRF
jgi:hypothetical protein